VQARLRGGDGRVRLRIDPRCATLIESLTQYHFDSRKAETGKAVPVKGEHDHAADALRYLVVNLDTAPHEVRTRAY
jgi:hypothetical protein